MRHVAQTVLGVYSAVVRSHGFSERLGRPAFRTELLKPV